MKQLHAAALAAILWAVPCLADGVAVPANVEASFDEARLADDLTGTLTDTNKEDRVGFYASQNSTLTVTLMADTTSATPIVGATLALCDEAGNALATGDYDKSHDGMTIWKKVPLPASGRYSLVIRASAAGAWRLKLAGKLASTRDAVASTSDLAVGGEASADIRGLRGGTLTFSLLRGSKNSQFAGVLLRVERPDGSVLPGTLSVSKGKVVLDADGVHKLVFRNAGAGIGPWAVQASAKPGPIYVRHGVVSPSGTALTPVVLKLLPSSDFHGDDALSFAVVGRDFQQGADLRLVRDNFADIIGTNVVVDSETEIRCDLNLDTAPVTGSHSTGKWRVGVWNAPVYAVPGDPATLDKTASPNDQKKTFNSLSAASITLPAGVAKGTEVWHLDFNDDFQADLNLMGLGSNDKATETAARNMVERYVVCFLRVLMRQNEQSGKTASGSTPGLSFVIDRIPSVAGKAGRDYDRLEIGGAWQTGDPRDVAEPLLWGYSDIDVGNTRRDDLSVNIDDGAGGTTRAGLGVRTRVLDPGSGSANPDWVAATAPLRQVPLAASDRIYFLPGYAPVTTQDANRYRDVVNQTTRVSREIAAICAHQIGRAMGLFDEGSGPMANPSTAGYFWPTTAGLLFADADLQTIRGNIVPNELPGKSAAFSVRFFPFISLQPYKMPDCTTSQAYSVKWFYVGGRPNAVPGDYTVKYVQGNPPLGLTLGYDGLAGTAPLWLDQTQNLFYCTISYFRVLVTDTVRKTSANFVYRLNMMPNIPLLPAPLQPNATNCRNTILSTP